MNRVKFFSGVILIIGMMGGFAIGGKTLLAQEFDPHGRAYKTDVSRSGTSAGTMLEIGVGARAEALGGAFASIANDPSALYWNPAGITQISSVSAQFMRLNWFVGTTFNSFDMVVPIMPINWALGFHLAMLDYGEAPVRTVFRPDGTGEVYTARDMVAGLYMAMAITDRISAGLGAKYFYERIWHEKGSTIALDLSILYKTPVKGLRLGGTISNFGTEFSLHGRDLTRVMDVDGRKDRFFNNDEVPVDMVTEGYPLPLLFRFGISYDWVLNAKNSFTFAVDANHPSDNTESLNLGVEFKTFNSVFLRAGYQSLFERGASNGLCLGAGFVYRILGQAVITVDYAWSDWSIMQSVNRFTIGISGY